MAYGLGPALMDSYKISLFSCRKEGLLPYRGLIFSRFLNGIRYGNPLLARSDSRGFYRAYHALLERLLSRPDCTVRVAVLTDDPDVALGFSIARPDVLDFVFVKRDARRQGIGRALLPAAFSRFSQSTQLGDLIVERSFPTVKFDPFS